jgi:hypothetical protein
MSGLALAQETGDPRGMAQAASQLGVVALRKEDPDGAEVHFRSALEQAIAARHWAFGLEALVGLAEVSLRRGQAVEAGRMLGYVLNHYAIEDEIQTQAEALIDELRATLSQDKLTDALDQGALQNWLERRAAPAQA